VIEMLTDLGYKVLKAKDAQSALAIVESGVPIHLLFTDVVMPGPLRSTELARKTRERLPAIAVLFTSGYTDNAIVHAGRLDEGIELLSKPYTFEALARKVRYVISNQRGQSLDEGASSVRDASPGVLAEAQYDKVGGRIPDPRRKTARPDDALDAADADADADAGSVAAGEGLPDAEVFPPGPAPLEMRSKAASNTKTPTRQPTKIFHFLPGFPGCLGSSDSGSTGPGSVSAVTVRLPTLADRVPRPTVIRNVVRQKPRRTPI
jgi:CheY-like chemotaxis protein